MEICVGKKVRGNVYKCVWNVKIVACLNKEITCYRFDKEWGATHSVWLCYACTSIILTQSTQLE